MKTCTHVRDFTSCFGIRIDSYCKTHPIDYIRCVRWDQNGERLASSSDDGTIKVLDFASGKITYTGETEDGSKSFVLKLTINLAIA